MQVLKMRHPNIFSKKVFEMARKMPDIMPEMFVALEEYDRTGKLPVNFTLDPALFEDYKEYCEKHGCKMSTLIEKAMKDKLGNTANI